MIWCQGCGERWDVGPEEDLRPGDTGRFPQCPHCRKSDWSFVPPTAAWERSQSGLITQLLQTITALERRIAHLEQFAVGRCEVCGRFTDSLDMWRCKADQSCRPPNSNVAY